VAGGKMERTTLLLALFKFSLGSMFLLLIRCKKRVIVKDRQPESEIQQKKEADRERCERESEREMMMIAFVVILSEIM